MGLRITYNIQYGHCIVYSKDLKFQFNKDKIGLPWIYANKPQGVTIIQTVQQKYKGSSIKML